MIMRGNFIGNAPDLLWVLKSQHKMVRDFCQCTSFLVVEICHLYNLPFHGAFGGEVRPRWSFGYGGDVRALAFIFLFSFSTRSRRHGIRGRFTLRRILYILLSPLTYSSSRIKVISTPLGLFLVRVTRMRFYGSMVVKTYGHLLFQDHVRFDHV